MGGRGANSGAIAYPVIGKKGRGLFKRYANMLDEAVKGVPSAVVNLGATIRNLVNPNFYKGKEYRNNCALCTTAGALQIMGYDVEAMPYGDRWRGPNGMFGIDFSNYDNFVAPSGNINWAEIDSYARSRKNPNKFGRGANKVADQIDSYMSKWGSGAIASISVKWKGGGAHDMLVYRHKSTTMILDFQSGRTYIGKNNIESLLKKTVANNTALIRLDNAPLKYSVVSFFSGPVHLQEQEMRKMVRRRT